MKSKLLKELPALILILLPLIYLIYLWSDLPDMVPVHWNLNGEIDRYGSKSELLLVVILLPAFIYALFLLIPLIDPKKKINLMGDKYQSFKNILIGFMSFLLILILYSAKNESFSNPNWIFIAIGILFIVLGNFFKTIRPNYFMGIKTPWTLENETVWKDTHVLGGKIWFIGGIVITLASMVLSSKVNVIVFLIITGILILVPVIFSYLRFQEIDKKGLS